MPFGDNAAEDFVLGQTAAFGSGVAKEYKKSTQKKRQRDLMNYMERMGMQNQIADASNQRLTYDPNSPSSEKQVVLALNKMGAAPSKYVLRDKQEPIIRDLNMLKDLGTFAADDPETFGDVLKLGLMQSPVKAVGRLGEATWARGNDNYQNDLSKQFYDSYMQKDTENQQERWRDPNQKTMTGEPLYPLGTDKAKTGSYDDMMKRIEAFMMHKEILGSMESDFTSDTTFGDFADTVSWFIPGPGIIGTGVKGAVKGGAAVGKGVKGMRTALAAAKASGFAGDVSSGFKMGVGAFAGMPLGTAGGGSGLRLGKISGFGGRKTKLAVGAAVGAGVYASQEEDAEAFKGSSIVKALAEGNSREAHNILKASLRGRNRGDALRNKVSTAANAMDFRNFAGQYKRPTSARNPSTLAAKQEKWDSQVDVLGRWNIFSTKNPNWSASGDEIHHGHINPRSKGGSTSPSNWEYMTKEANDAIGDRDLSVFVRDEMKKTNLPLAEALAEVKNRWSFNHIPDNVLLGAKA